MNNNELKIQTGLNTAKAHKMLSNAIKTLRYISNRYYYFLKSNPLIGFEIVVQRHPYVRKCTCKSIALDIENILECITHNSHKDIKLVLHIVKGDKLEDFYNARFLKSLKKPLDPVSLALIASTISEMKKRSDDNRVFYESLGSKISQEIGIVIDKYRQLANERRAEYIDSIRQMRDVVFSVNEEIKKMHSSYDDNDEEFDREFLGVHDDEDTTAHVECGEINEYIDLA